MTHGKTRATTAGALLIAILAVLYSHGRGWLGGPFPGFFIFDHRATRSGSPPADPLSRGAERIQDAAVPAADPYREAAGSRLGRDSHPTRQDPDRASALPAFGPEGPFRSLGTIASAFLCFAVGLVVRRARPEDEAARAVFLGSATAALFLATQSALLPEWCHRLHMLTHAILPATLLHLALVFPAHRLGPRRLPLLVIYLPFAALGGLYQLGLGQAEHATVDQIARVGVALSIAVVVAALLHGLFCSPFPLVRRRAAIAALGAAAALSMPLALVAGCEGLGPKSGHPVGLTAFLLPLALGYAVVKRDLFEIDRTLRRALAYAVPALLLLGLQLAALSGARRAGWLASGSGSPALLLTLNLGLLILLHLSHKPAGRWIERVLQGCPYNPEQSLIKLIHALERAGSVTAAVRIVQEALLFTFHPTYTGIFLREQRGGFHPTGGDSRHRPLALPPPILEDLLNGQAVSCHRWPDGSPSAPVCTWPEARAELLVPIQAGGATIGLLALGPRHRGGFYNGDDVRFLKIVASQAGLALTGAGALEALRETNANLERQVEERTAAMSAANAELNAANAQLKSSLAELQQAYDQLEQNHTCLLRADRLATLGRLSAGIAHEVNTPLSAVQNALRVLCELGHEYASSIDDPTVLPADHHEIAREIVATARSASEWAQKAALFIRSTKAHGRNAGAAAAEPFSVGALAIEVRDLLMHRLRAAGCQLVVQGEAADASLIGNRAAFGQVLLNLITNALDAYEDAGKAEGRIVVTISRTSDAATVEVQDWAGGIPLQILPRIFEEMFTTKGAGRGTGLGLWISRTIVEKEFGGQLDVLTSPGEGSRFIATIPFRRVQAGAESAAPARSAA